MRIALAILLTLLIAIPISAVLTIVLSPFWNWFELRTGIESIGHSGPAGWCYIAISIIVVTCSAGAWLLFKPRKN